MDIEQIRQKAREVIRIEAEMIASLENKIDEQFAHACLILHQCTGKIVVIGVGKSGHIAKKIAATLASTGRPAFFIHPSEAKHGDIGMIRSNDAVLMLSNSGESDEIIDIIPSLKRLNVPVIALTSKPHSTLAKAATIHINVAVEKEACPLGLAPTSSTTAALVMGDAIAMVLLDKLGFTPDDFARSHPGGTLGKRLLLQVSELMHKDDALPLVNEHSSLKDTLIQMTQKKLGLAIVVNDQKELSGIFTDGDVRRMLDHPVDLKQTKIHTLMSSKPKTISRTLLAADALSLMEKYKITSLIIANEHHHPEGVIHIHDILRAGVV